jgi:hypothetical protein
MLSLLKKSGGDKAATRTIPWRPDFRDFEQLPDVKTVRAALYVNIAAIAVTALVVLLVVQREWSVISLRNTLANVETDIEQTQPKSESARAAFTQFQAEERRFREAHALVSDPFRLADFLVHLGTINPLDVNVRRVDFRGPGQTLTILGAVRGLDAAASDVASQFVRQLQTDPVLKTHFEAISLTNLGRNVDEGSLNLELVFTFKKPGGAAR